MLVNGKHFRIVSIAIIMDARCNEIRNSLCIWSVEAKCTTVNCHTNWCIQKIQSILAGSSAMFHINIIDIVSRLLCHIKMLIWISFDRNRELEQKTKCYANICIRTNENCQYLVDLNALINSWSNGFSIRFILQCISWCDTVIDRTATTAVTVRRTISLHAHKVSGHLHRIIHSKSLLIQERGSEK